MDCKFVSVAKKHLTWKFFRSTLGEVGIFHCHDAFTPQKQQYVACEQLQWKASPILFFLYFFPTNLVQSKASGVVSGGQINK